MGCNSQFGSDALNSIKDNIASFTSTTDAFAALTKDGELLVWNGSTTYGSGTTYNQSEVSTADASGPLTNLASLVNIFEGPAPALSSQQISAISNSLSIEISDNTDPSNASDTYGSVTGSLNWEISLDNSSLQGMVPGEKIYATYRISVGSPDNISTKDVQIEISGINDAPVATFSDSQSAIEGTSSINGQLTSSDVDASGSPVFALTGADIPGLIINSDGSWSFDPSTSAYDSLRAGEIQTINVGYVVTDDQNASANGSFLIELTGTNDAPVATFSDSQSAIEGTASINGQLTSTDVDASGAPVYELLGAEIPGLTINADGSWSFDPTNPAYDDLAKDELKTINVSYSVDDNQGGTDQGSFSIALTGTNDAPVATFSESQSAIEGTASINGQLTSTDVDASGAPVYELLGAEIPGLTINADGSWSFDPTNPAYDDLAKDELKTINVSYSVDDNQGGTDQGSFSIELTGTNDAPVATFSSPNPLLKAQHPLMDSSLLLTLMLPVHLSTNCLVQRSQVSPLMLMDPGRLIQLTPLTTTSPKMSLKPSMSATPLMTIKVAPIKVPSRLN